MNSNDWCVVCRSLENQIVLLMKEFISKECKLTNSSFWKKIDQHFAEIKIYRDVLQIADEELEKAMEKEFEETKKND